MAHVHEQDNICPGCRNSIRLEFFESAGVTRNPQACQSSRISIPTAKQAPAGSWAEEARWPVILVETSAP
ncbi:uncharacterized protein ARMOST_12996 [Armillaria ostoyae]|uniref:Uncharacterized protein n=1 Tax=Armillaria ostoyae TaxID=47428 RepID=A0A284RLH6_ARMOS|nr:uncharacterized protein ARMOST_12996 [Armillaria ostoyae]